MSEDTLQSQLVNDLIDRLEDGFDIQINPFVPNAPFLYPLKTSENRKVEKGCIGNKWNKYWRSVKEKNNTCYHHNGCVVTHAFLYYIWKYWVKKTGLIFETANNIYILFPGKLWYT